MPAAIHLFSFLYRMGCRFRNLFFDKGLLPSAAAPLPVVSVGNLEFGGSGKTPLSMELLRFFLANGIRPALITRGYRGKWEHKGGVLSEGKGVLGGWRDSGDEPFMASRAFPAAGVYVGKDRLTSCRKAQAAGFQIAVLDDGFQHRQLKRNLDIVLFDPGEKIRLREPVSALKRTHMVLIRTDPNKVSNWRRRYPLLRFYPFQVIPQGLFKAGTEEPQPFQKGELRYLALCGIARPERFAPLLDQAGIQPVEVLHFPDHHSYPARSLRRIRQQLAATGADAVLTTEKDAVKLEDSPFFQDVPLYFLRIGLKIDPDFYTDVLASVGPPSVP